VQPSLATDKPAEAGPVDVIIMAVKAGQVRDAGIASGPLIGPGTFVVPLQNGIEAASQLLAVLDERHVVAGLCGVMSWVTGPGHIRTLGDFNFIRFGELDNRRSERVERLRQVFEKAGVKAEIPDDIHKALWEKFLFVVSLGGVGAMKRQPYGMLRDDAESRRMLECCMQEIYALARARGVDLDDSVVARTMGYIDSLPADGTTSMQRDLAEAKPSELEAWTGAVVRLAKDSGVETPVNDFVYRTLLPVEQRARRTASA